MQPGADSTQWITTTNWKFLLDSASLYILNRGRCENFPPFFPFSQSPSLFPFSQSPSLSPFIPIPLPFPLHPNPPPFTPSSQSPPFSPSAQSPSLFFVSQSPPFPLAPNPLPISPSSQSPTSWVGENPGYEVQIKWGMRTRYRSIEDGNLTSIKEKHV